MADERERDYALKRIMEAFTVGARKKEDKGVKLVAINYQHIVVSLFISRFAIRRR